MHEHFDADGRLTGTTVITRETEWDDETQARAMALATYEESLCPCGCGLPIAVGHEKRAFNVETFTCYAGRALAVARRYDEEQATKEKRPEGWRDGMHYIVSASDPEEGKRGN